MFLTKVLQWLFLTLIVELVGLGVLFYYVNWLWVLGYLAAAALAGAALIKWALWRPHRVLRRAAKARRPGRPFRFLVVLAAGVLLIIPGVLTDALALALLLVPPLGQWIGGRMMDRWIRNAGIQMSSFAQRFGDSWASRDDAVVDVWSRGPGEDDEA